MNFSDLVILIDKYLAGEATEEEQKTVDDWYDAFDVNEGFTTGHNAAEVQQAKKNGFISLQNRLD